MSVLRYCCFRWLIYDRALVFEPSRPLACIMMLLWLIFIFRVVLWYLPVSPWSWLYTFACMTSGRLNRGRHTVWIIQTFEILKWQLFFLQNAFVGCHYSSAPSLKMDTKNTTTCQVPFHDSMPSFMNFRRVLYLLEFKNQESQCFAGNQRCPGVWNSFPFLAWDLSMHPRT